MNKVSWGNAEIDHLIAQRAPFRFLSRIHAWAAAPAFLHGSHAIDPHEPVLVGHFPGSPIWPGALTVEGLAQAAGALEALLHLDGGPDPGGAPPLEGRPRDGQMVMGSVQVRLLAPVRPGVRLDYRVWRLRAEGSVRAWRVEASVGPQVVARGQLVGARLVEEPAP